MNNYTLRYVIDYTGGDLGNEINTQNRSWIISSHSRESASLTLGGEFVAAKINLEKKGYNIIREMSSLE